MNDITGETRELLEEIGKEDVVTISLDVESVIADTHSYFLNVYNSLYGTAYTTQNIDNWDWVRNEVEWKVFDGITHGGWKNEAEKIQLRERNINTVLKELHENENVCVDIITARNGVEDEMIAWLESHGITNYNEFISTTQKKPSLGYNVYIDDNPNLRGTLTKRQLQFQIRGTHNRGTSKQANVIDTYTINNAVNVIKEYI